MFEDPISNNKEEVNIAPLPLGRPWQKLFNLIYLDIHLTNLISLTNPFFSFTQEIDALKYSQAML